MSISKALPIGSDSFREIRKADKYYIDKTLMIKDFIESDDKVALICRPRRFGKTLNMTMIRDFFDITQDSRAIFEGLAIMDTEYASQINSRPVIYFSLKDCNGRNPEELQRKLCEALLPEFIKHFNVAKENAQKIAQFAFFEKLYNRMLQREVTLIELSSSLKLLEEVVALAYGVNPILLLDEYDTPIMSSHEYGYHEEVAGFITDFYGSALKGQQYLSNALLTGIQRVAKESIFSKLNNVRVYSMLKPRYANYFGLTTEETEEILNCYGLELNAEVRQMYDGYKIGGYDIYNPWSILNYCDEKQLNAYWINTSSNTTIKECLSNLTPGFQTKFNTLIEDGAVSVGVNLETSYAELERSDTLWGLFINAGYLTVEEVLDIDYLKIRIPNREVKQEFRKIISTNIGVESGDFSAMTRALTSGDYDTFATAYKTIIRDCVSYYDLANNSNKYENPYHMLTLGMVLSLDYLYDIKSNYESGDGRADIRMVSKEPNKRAHIVIEFKRTEDLVAGAEEALQQIIEKRYADDLIEKAKAEGGEVLLLGIAHDSKKCEIKMQLANV